MKFSLSLMAVGLVLPAVMAGGRGGGGGGGGGHGSSNDDDDDCTTTTTKPSTTSATPVPTATPSTCVYLGCYSDPLGLPTRQLTYNSQVSEEAQTHEECQETCTSMGLRYAGLEYYFECWCGDLLHNNDTVTIDPSKCTYPCSGDATQTCGGQAYMDLYDCSAAIPEPEEYNDCVPLGCHTDAVSDRALKTSVQGGDEAQTNEACTEACIALGFRFAGTEFGRECWCADELGSTGVLAPDGNEQCNMPCTGNSTQICGGKDRLNVFDCEFPTASGTAPSVVTVAPTSAPCPARLVSDFHGCFDNKKKNSLEFCYEWLDAQQVAPVTVTTTRRSGPRDLRYHGRHGSYGGKPGNTRCKTKIGKWPKLEAFNDDEIDRACRCHVGQWWTPQVVTKTVGR